MTYLHSYLLFITINKKSSGLLPVTSSVPQGRILGPLLFVIYNNDLLTFTNFAYTLLYADDTKCVQSISNAKYCKNLQQDIDSFCLLTTLHLMRTRLFYFPLFLVNHFSWDLYHQWLSNTTQRHTQRSWCGLLQQPLPNGTLKYYCFEGLQNLRPYPQNFQQ